MLTILEERREAGGTLAPIGHDYASTLTCLGKVMSALALVQLVLFLALLSASDRVGGFVCVGVGMSVVTSHHADRLCSCLLGLGRL